MTYHDVERTMTSHDVKMSSLSIASTVRLCFHPEPSEEGGNRVAVRIAILRITIMRFCKEGSKLIEAVDEAGVLGDEFVSSCSHLDRLGFLDRLAFER
jgi:hypothetical protein